MNEPVTLLQVVITALVTVVTALAPQLYSMYSRYRDSKDKEKQLEQEEEFKKDERKLTETEKLYREWENVVNGYVRQIESLRHLETENAELRPLLLKVALVQQENKQLKDDKEDWKDYADRLAQQLESANIIPLPFRRTPRDGDTQEKIKKISTKMKSVTAHGEDINKTAANDTIIDANSKAPHGQTISPADAASKG